jgi:hypothetical protein
MALRTAAKCGLLLLALVGPASSLAAPSIFCCNDDEAGRQVCGDVLPSACYGRAYRELGYSGRTARTVEAPLTGEQRAQRAAEEQRRSEQERLLNEQRRKDQALLNTYGSEKDIEIMRSRAERDLAAAIKAAEERIAEIRRQRKKFEDEAEFYKKRQLPADVAKGSARCRSRDQGAGVGDRVQEKGSGCDSTEVRRGSASLCRAVESGHPRGPEPWRSDPRGAGRQARASTPFGLSAEFPAQQFADLLRVGLASRRLHCLTDQCVERLLLARPELGDHRRVGGQQFIDQSFQRAACR